MADRVRRVEYLEFLETQENRRKKKFNDRISYFEMYDDVDFHMRYRLTKENVLQLLELIEPQLCCTNINNSVKPIEQLLLALRFYATGAFQIVVGDLSNCSQPTACRIIHKVSRVIASMSKDFIRMPETEEECSEVADGFYNIAGFPLVLGAIDCSHIPISSPGGNDAERFRCRKGFFSINTQTVISADLEIRHVVARWPGSAHDSTILSNSTVPQLMQTGARSKYHLIGDSGYPCVTYNMTTLGNPSSRPEERYNKSHILTRNTVERKYGVAKRRFPCLAMKLRCDIENVPAIIVSCCVLHNIALKLGDPQPPIDPDVIALFDDFTSAAASNVSQQASSGTAAGFARRQLLIQQFFT